MLCIWIQWCVSVLKAKTRNCCTLYGYHYCAASGACVCVCGAVHFVDGWWWRTLLFPTWGWSTTRWEWWSSMIRVFTDEHPGDRSPSQNHHWEPLQAGICSYHIYILLWWHSHTLLTALTVLLQRLLVWCVLYLCIHAWNVTHWQFVGVKHAVSTRLYKQTRADCSWRVCMYMCMYK